MFVPLTLGLSILVAIMETKYAKSGDEIYNIMTKFWGELFLINFVLGTVTGTTLEFQFGTNWSRYSVFVGATFYGFNGLYSNMFTSSINPAFSLTAYNASSSPLTIKIMFIVALIFVPIVLACQIWSYNLFKEKVTKDVLDYE